MMWQSPVEAVIVRPCCRRIKPVEVNSPLVDQTLKYLVHISFKAKLKEAPLWRMASAFQCNLASQKKGVLHVPSFFFFGNQERLPFVWKTRKFRGEFKWNGLSRWKLSGKKNNTFRGITFFPFLPKQPEYSVPFVCITSARLQVERKRKIYLYFVNGTLNPVPVFGAKKIPVPFDGRFSPNSRAKKSIYQITIQGHFVIGQRQKLMS